MIISHEHKFIFLKTKKTAGTAIEAALSELCGAVRRDHALSRGERAGPQGPRPPQNYRIEHRLKPKRPLWRKLLDAPRALLPPERRLLRAHAGLARARLCRRGGVAELFQIRLRPQSMGPAGLLVSLQDQDQARAAELRALHGRPRAALTSPTMRNTRSTARSPSTSSAATKASKTTSTARSSLPAPARAFQSRASTSRPNKDEARSYRSYYSPDTQGLVAEWYEPEIALLGYGF